MTNISEPIDEFEDDDARYVTTAKGIAVLAMLQCGLIQSMDDPRFEGFWRIFEQDMLKAGYIVEGDD